MAKSANESKKRAERMRVLIRMLKRNDITNHGTLLKELRREFDDVAYTLTRQTLYRDLDYLESLGASVKFDKEQNSYILLNTNWSGYASLLEPDEMEAAVLGAQFAERILPDSPLRDKIRGSVDALWGGNCLPEDSADVQWKALAIHGQQSPIRREVFQTIFEQWRSLHDVTITYTAASNGRTRTLVIEPHALTFYNGTWYVRGRLAARPGAPPAEFRTFALHRISKAVKEEHLFEPDTAEIENVSQGRTFNFPKIAGVRMKVRGKCMMLAHECLPIDEAVPCPEENGAELLTLREIDDYRVVNFVMQAAGDAVILGPAALREQVRGQAAAILKSME